MWVEKYFKKYSVIIIIITILIISSIIGIHIGVEESLCSLLNEEEEEVE